MGGPQNVTLDGVVQDPDGAEGFARGGWFTRSAEWAAVALEEALAAEAWLLGRRSYEFFAARWRPRTGALADRLNGLPKYVVSATPPDRDWGDTTVIGGDVVEAVRRLREERAGEIVVPGSGRLGRTLIENGLVDELRMVVFPVVLGAGERLLAGVRSPVPLRLVGTRTLGDGLVHVRYRAARPASPR